MEEYTLIRENPFMNHYSTDDDVKIEDDVDFEPYGNGIATYHGVAILWMEDQRG